MTRLVLIAGCLLLLTGLFYDSLPLELFGALWKTFSGNTYVYYRIVPSEHIDYIQVALLALGAILVVGGLVRRRSPASTK